MSSEWQLELKDLKSRVKHIFETKALADCSFEVGEGDHQQLVEAHKSILSAASPVLHDKLSDVGGDHPKVTITDIEPEIFQLMLTYIYMDSVNFDVKTVNDLAAAAKTYQMPHLLKACLDYILTQPSNVTTKNVLQVYDLSLHSSESDELKKKCEEIIKADTMAVLSDSSFLEACPDVVEAMFSLEPLDIDSEVDLLIAADRYAKHISERGGADEAVRKILEKIRFLTLTPEEFAKGRASTTILSASDACAILSNVVYDKAGVPMPSGFSLRKDIRKNTNKVLTMQVSEIKFTIPIPDIKYWIKKNEKSYTSIFMLQNLRWQVLVSRTGEVTERALAIYVFCNYSEDKSETWSCKAKVELSLLRADESPYSREFTYVFSEKTSNQGYNSFMPFSEMIDPNNHYVKDGGLTFQVNIKADKPLGL